MEEKQVCKNCNCKIIAIWRNPKEHSQTGEQEYTHDGLKRMCSCGCNTPEPKQAEKISKISDVPFNKITEMICVVTSPKSQARIGLLAELLAIKEQLRLIEEEKKEAKKK